MPPSGLFAIDRVARCSLLPLFFAKLSLFLLVSMCLVVAGQRKGDTKQSEGGQSIEGTELYELAGGDGDETLARGTAHLERLRQHEHQHQHQHQHQHRHQRRLPTQLIPILVDLCAQEPNQCISDCVSLELMDNEPQASLICGQMLQSMKIIGVDGENDNHDQGPPPTLESRWALQEPNWKLILSALRHQQRWPPSTIDSVRSVWSRAAVSTESAATNTRAEEAAPEREQLARVADSEAVKRLHQSARVASDTSHELRTRAWHQLARNPNTYRVSLDAARSFIEAQKEAGTGVDEGRQLGLSMVELMKDGDGSQASRYIFGTSTGGVSRVAKSGQLLTALPLMPQPLLLADTQQRSDRGLARERELPEGHAPVDQRRRSVLLPKRMAANGALGDQPGLATAMRATTSDRKSDALERTGMAERNSHRRIQTRESTSGAGEAAALSCEMRRYTYRATKSDGLGNSCTGLVTARICYGGCDTGEIADWLFPHKKSIHKVCRHGGRTRRRALLSSCTSKSASVNEQLRDYHYVDAHDCVCKKCTSVDTTCLGTMTRPQLQTLSEATAHVDPASMAGDSAHGPVNTETTGD